MFGDREREMQRKSFRLHWGAVLLSWLTPREGSGSGSG
jgi:hypothetical protein